MITLILLLIKDILKTRLHRGNNLLKTLTAIFVSMFSLCSAQSVETRAAAGQVSPLQAGERIPEAVWGTSFELHDFKGQKKTVRLSELKGKLILFDFWATSCPSCIENLPHMEEIQKRYPKQVTVILVNSKRNRDTNHRIKLLLDSYRKKYNFEIGLATVLEDTVLTGLFPHNTIPNIAWVNQEGVFLGNTLPGEVGTRNIEAILQNKTADLQLRGEFRNRDITEEIPPIFDTTGVKFLSAIRGYLPDYLPTYPNVVSKNGKSNYQMLNAAFNFMLLTAFKNELQEFGETDYVFEDGLKGSVQAMLQGGLRQQHQYCYQLFVADTISSAGAERYFRQAFTDYFRLKVERKHGRIAYYSVEILDNISDLTSKGGLPQANVNPEDGPLYFQNYPLITLLGTLHLYMDLPVSIEHHPEMRIDLKFPVGFERMQLAEKIAFLAEKGIRFTMESQEKEYPYISRID